MNILVISPRIYPCTMGGLEIANYYLINELAKRGHDVWVFTTCKHNWNDKNVHVIKLNENFLLHPMLSTNFHIFLELVKLRKKVDIVNVPYTSNSPLSYPMLLAKKLFDIRYIISIHGGGMYPWKPKTPHKLFFKHADAIVAVSEPIRKEYEKRSGRAIKLILPLVPFSESKISKKQLRKIYGLKSDVKVILSIGSIKKIKGSDTLLNAFLGLGKMYIEKNNLMLLYVGDGPMRPMLAEKAEEKGYSGCVKFLGTIPHEKVLHIYKLADIYVISSLFEGTPLALLEAMFNGLPIIGTDVDGINTIIRNRKNGLLFEKGNAKDLIEKIKELVENRDLSNKLSETAKRDYLQNHEFENTISEYIELFTRLGKEKND